MQRTDIVIMAAGQGTRMKSRKPKVLQELAGRPLLGHVLAAAARLQPRSIVVVCGHGAAQVEAASRRMLAESAGIALRFVLQQPQRGTGHAVQQAAPALPDDGLALVLNGDVPLVRAQTLQRLLDTGAQGVVALLTVDTGGGAGAYGRVLRSAPAAAVHAIVEARDATPEQLALTEWYSGVMAAPTRLLKKYLAQLTDDNAQREFYLTDVVRHAVADGTTVAAVTLGAATEVAGVNSPEQLAALERQLQRMHAGQLMAAGVRLADPARLDLRDDARSGVQGELVCGSDVEIDVGCIFTGRVEIGAGARIGAYCCIANARIAAGAEIRPYTHIDGEQEGVHVGEGARVGPFARLRAGARLAAEVHVGNFVEVKNSTLARGAKANHLAYVGDAALGERVNYGAGCITANYDGVNKHHTAIGADVRVGSNCVLVAPVVIGAGGTVGAGSIITQDTEPGALTVARARQVSKPGWQRPRKQAKP
ncbi:MAG: bifunctional UDP-N-acetylglucosamine diphosphorylase/glucosamine-1-phosphate N-acetyltransferase GlmU [Ottowia sp.]|nr:bifunctional UDP-N-acetylglucosamine diphosphorylase/glucosamine-1-phosphate N-acetyltransferase GlmU [Ottowia sp.]